MTPLLNLPRKLAKKYTASKDKVGKPTLPYMNRYLEKVAELLSDENKQVGKTFAVQTAASIPAHIAGGVIGAKLGNKYLKGTAETLARHSNTLGDNLGKLGRVGKWIGNKVRFDASGGGRALGVGLGMMTVGGLADLASLKASMHEKVKGTNE